MIKVPLCFLCTGLILLNLFGDVKGSFPYYGTKIGALKRLHHGVSGDVYAVDSRTIFIKKFNYDGEAPAAYFYMGTTDKPSNEGATRLRDERGGVKSLTKRYRNKDITLSLPDGKTLRDFKWFSVWCDEFAVNFGDVSIPSTLDFPRPQKITGLAGVHDVGSDSIVIVDAQTLLVPNFSYDGEAPDAKFWVGRGQRPSPQGVRIPDENGSENPLRRYEKKNIVLTLPGDLTIFDIGHFGVWCEAFTVDFGHVRVPEGLNVPPSLKMLGISPQSKLNCEVLYDDLAFEVRWAVAGESIVLQLVAKLADNEYMSFGISPSNVRSEMVGADVAVAWVGRDGKGHAVDYYLSDKSQCSGGRGSCPDDEIEGNTNSVLRLNAAMVNGYSIVTYQRSLRAADQLDLPISITGKEAIVWAIGPLNDRNQTSFHTQYTKGTHHIEFGRPPTWNCPMPAGGGGDDEEDSNAEEENTSTKERLAPTGASNGDFTVTGGRGQGYPPARGPSLASASKSSDEEEFYEPPLALQRNSSGRPVPTPKSAATKDAWDIPPIQCDEPEDGVFYAQMGPTGGKHGYPAITGHVGWGISWYINGLLIPEIHVVRGKTYTFVTEGGQNPDIPAKYHPFYITDDPVGGYEHKREEEKQAIRIFAGVERTRSGQVKPIGVGRLCNWTPDPDGPPADDYQSFGAYQRTLKLICEPDEPGVITWKPDAQTPDTVYYHCFTHRYLGWKIHVHDTCDVRRRNGNIVGAASERHETNVAAPQHGSGGAGSSGGVEFETDEYEELAGAPSIRHETKVSPNESTNTNKLNKNFLTHASDLLKNHNMNGTPPKLTFEITKSTEITQLISDGIRAAEALEQSILRSKAASNSNSNSNNNDSQQFNKNNNNNQHQYSSFHNIHFQNNNQNTNTNQNLNLNQKQNQNRIGDNQYLPQPDLKRPFPAAVPETLLAETHQTTHHQHQQQQQQQLHKQLQSSSPTLPHLTHYLNLNHMHQHTQLPHQLLNHPHSHSHSHAYAHHSSVQPHASSSSHNYLLSPHHHHHQHHQSSISSLNLTALPALKQAQGGGGAGGSVVDLSEYLRPPFNTPLFHPVKLPGRRPLPSQLKKTPAGNRPAVLPQHPPGRPAVRIPQSTIETEPQSSVIVSHYRKPVPGLLKPFFKEKPFPLQPLAASVLLLGQPTAVGGGVGGGGNHRKSSNPTVALPVPYVDLLPQSSSQRGRRPVPLLHDANQQSGPATLARPQPASVPTMPPATVQSVPPANSFKQPFDAHIIIKDNIATADSDLPSDAMQLAINEGFKPDTVVVESGFRPITRRDSGSSTIAPGSGVVEQMASRREDPAAEIDAAIQADMLYLAAAQRDTQQTQHFEPMFIPSPLDSTNATLKPLAASQSMHLRNNQLTSNADSSHTTAYPINTPFDEVPQLASASTSTTTSTNSVVEPSLEELLEDFELDGAGPMPSDDTEEHITIRIERDGGGSGSKPIATHLKRLDDFNNEAMMDEIPETDIRDIVKWEDLFGDDGDEIALANGNGLGKMKKAINDRNDDRDDADDDDDADDEVVVAQAAERIDTYYLPPDNRKIPDANLPSGAVVTYDGKSLVDSSLFLPPKLDSPRGDNGAANVRRHPGGLSKLEQLIRTTPQFVPFRGEIPPEISEFLSTERTNLPETLQTAAITNSGHRNDHEHIHSSVQYASASSSSSSASASSSSQSPSSSTFSHSSASRTHAPSSQHHFNSSISSNATGGSSTHYQQTRPKTTKLHLASSST